MSEYYKNLDKKKNNVTILCMTNNIYLVRDTVSKLYQHCFPAVNDGSAVRQVCDMFGKTPHFKDLELWRFDYGFNVETSEAVNVEKAVIALPQMSSDAPTMPMSEGVAQVELKR